MDKLSATPTAPADAQALPELRVTRFEDYPQIEKLEASRDLLTLSERDWCAIWRDHPLSARLGANWPIGWVLEDAGGSIVGSIANIPSQFTFQGRELIAATGRGWVVAEQFSPYALWVMDEHFNQSGVDLFINTTINALSVDTFASFGSVRVPLGDWNQAAFLITNYAGFARSALTIKHFPAAGLAAFPVAAALRLKDGLIAKHSAVRGNDFSIEFIEQFDERFDRFWNELKSQRPDILLNCRDRQTLAWHFAGPVRSKQIWILTASRGGLLRAYVILKRQDHPASGLTRMRLVDYQNLDSENALPSLMQAAIARCSSEKIHTLEHVGCDLPKMAEFDQMAPYRRQLPAWPYYFKAADPAFEKQLADPARWDASSFDGDSSL